jgi:hypothetical protein
MNYNTLQELIDAIKEARKIDGGCSIVVKDVQKELKIGFAILFSNGESSRYTLPLSRLRDRTQISGDKTKVIQDYFKAKIDFDKIEQEYINFVH